MSNALTRYGTLTGKAGGDARIQIGGKGRKNVLCMTAGYQRSTFAAVGANFQGRLVVVEGQINPLGNEKFAPVAPDFGIGADFTQIGNVLFDTLFSDVGPHIFFLPIAQQEGAPQSDESVTTNIILCIGQDTAAVGAGQVNGKLITVPPGTPPPAGGVYVPVLVVSGQTVFGGTLAGQQVFSSGLV